MTILTLAVLFAGTLAFAGATAAAVLYLAHKRGAALNLTRRLALLGAGLFLLALLLRGIAWHTLPMTTAADALVVFVIFATVVMFVSARDTTRAVASFYAPALFVLAVLGASLAPATFGHAPKELRGLFLAVHVGLAFLAYAFFLGASVASVAYLFQSRHLKKHRTVGLFQALPPLERLDKSLYRLIHHGYVMFAATLLTGAIWARVDRALLGPHWFLAPKVLQSVVMFLFYAFVFHGRQCGLLRGRKLAFAVLIGFSAMLGIYLARTVLNLSYYYFWEPSAWAS
ncbi:MAG: cytochrome c biogenesis protein CcsA [Candidatus Hydrogenedentales bacterium]|jgi:ABC-type uncharacterized transport system permease subunit